MSPLKHQLGLYERYIVFVINIVFSLAIGGIQYISGTELAFSALFLVPIIVTTWWVSLGAGIFLAVFSSGVWLCVDLLHLSTYSSILVPFINESLRLCVFLGIAYLLHCQKKMAREQEKMAVHDSLTGIFNRRGLALEGTREIDRARRTGNPMGIVFLDVDRFKSINDTLGHAEGDRLLRNVASTLKAHLRTMDIVGRLGGDEFVVILPRADAQSGRATVEKLVRILDYEMEMHQWDVSFSIGHVTFETAPASIHSAIDAADQLMYQAKMNGKNKIYHDIKRFDVQV